MRFVPCLALAFLAATLAPAQEVPGGKSLAELVRERFEAKPPGQQGGESAEGNREELPPAPPVTSISLGPTPPPAEPETETPDPTESTEGGETPPAGPEMPEPESGEGENQPGTETEPPGEKEPEPEPAEADPAPAAVPLPDIAPENATHVIKSGDTLTRVARATYNSSLFAPLLETHNQADPRRLKIGQELDTPSLSDLVREQGSQLLAHCPEPSALLIQIQHDYRTLEDLSRSGASKDEIHAAMDELEATATRIGEGFANTSEALGSRPTVTLSQLKQFHKNLASTRAGKISLLSKSGIRSRTYLATALVEAMKWGERKLK